MSEPLTNILQQSLSTFGRLLREICMLGGITAAVLSSRGVQEREFLVQAGDLKSSDPVGPMGELPILLVMAGREAPTYYQVYIWLRVLRRHFESPEFAQACKDLSIELPVFPELLERRLWKLAGFVSPEERSQVYESMKDVRLIEIESIAG